MQGWYNFEALNHDINIQYLYNNILNIIYNTKQKHCILDKYSTNWGSNYRNKYVITLKSLKSYFLSIYKVSCIVYKYAVIYWIENVISSYCWLLNRLRRNFTKLFTCRLLELIIIIIIINLNVKLLLLSIQLEFWTDNVTWCIISYATRCKENENLTGTLSTKPQTYLLVLYIYIRPKFNFYWEPKT